MQFDKWYFDFQNESMFGYYYVGFIRLNGLCISFSEGHHTGIEYPLEFYQTGLGCQKTPKSLYTSHAKIQFEKDHTELSLRKKNYFIKACWNHESTAFPLTYHPLYDNEYGRCTWKVWMPKSTVTLHTNGDHPLQLTGSGYIDFVRLTIPLWKIPFLALHWGRLYSDRDWIIVFHLQMPGKVMVYVADSDTWYPDAQFKVQTETTEHKPRFIWNFGREKLAITPLYEIQHDDILNSKRTRWLPSGLRKKLSRNGVECKYMAEACYHNKLYKGIMEEVRWNE